MQVSPRAVLGERFSLLRDDGDHVTDVLICLSFLGVLTFALYNYMQFPPKDIQSQYVFPI